MAKAKENNTDNTEKQEEQKKETKKEKNLPIGEDKTSKKKKGGGIVFVLFFMLLLIIMLVAIVGFNVFNIREKYLRSTIEKIPIVRNILPAKASVEGEEIPATIEELQAKVLDLERQISSQNNTITVLTDNNASLELENKRLKEIETKQLEFKVAKEEFDRLIATNDPDAYSKFYEQISPENAEILYTYTKMSAEQTKELKKYTDTFDNIDPTAGAGIIEEMIGTDMALASLILKNIDSEQRANIIAAMDPVKAASLVKYMAPNQ